jgi:hypothetical protein
MPIFQIATLDFPYFGVTNFKGVFGHVKKQHKQTD